jgi:hypothetical protein
VSIHTKRAALVVTVFLTFAVYRVVSDLLASGGLGGSEAILGFIVPSVLVAVFFVFWWRHRRASKAQPPSPAPRP